MAQKVSINEHRDLAHAGTHARPSRDLPERVDYQRLRWVAPLTAVGVPIGTAAVGVVEGALGLLPQDQALFQPGSIAIGTCVQVLIAIAVFALIGKITRHPITIFRVVGLVVLALSFLNPIAAGLGGMPGVSISAQTVLALMLLHVVAGGLTISVLTSQARAQ